MSQTIKIKKGLDIPLVGTADKILTEAPKASVYAIKPPDFEGLTPKILAKPEAKVKVGTPLFYDKYNPDIVFTSPVGGVIEAVVRGERRRVLEIKVKASESEEFEQFKHANPADLSKDEIIENILKSGLWPFIRQRPYAVIANPKDAPKSIHISTFDSAPLAPDNNFVVEGQADAFQTGIDAVAKLTDGKVHLNISADQPASEVFTNAKGVQINSFSGPHPAGNVGVQIHHIEPINKGDIVWYLYPQDVIAIGNLFKTGKLNSTRIVALTGSEVKDPVYMKTRIGTSVQEMIASKLTNDNVRIISGNVLTGTKIDKFGFLGFYDTQITIIPEGTKSEFLGWGTPGFGKYSLSRTFFSWLAPKKQRVIDSNMRGGERPFVVTGEYEKVFPMDILPVHLLKAIIIEDIDMMEQLGIYEVADEDFALCEFSCASKIESQAIIRKGLALMRKEFS